MNRKKTIIIVVAVILMLAIATTASATCIRCVNVRYYPQSYKYSKTSATEHHVIESGYYICQDCSFRGNYDFGYGQVHYFFNDVCQNCKYMR